MAPDARKQQGRRHEAPRAPERHTPAVIAIERLAKLAMAGTPANKMVAAARGIVADWRASGIQPSALSDHIAALRSDIDGGVSAAEDYVADADETDRPKARTQLEALRATQEALKAEMHG